MDVNNATSVAIDIVVILSSGIVLQSIQILCRKKGYPLIASKLFSLKNEKLIFHFSKQFWKWTWHFFCFILELIVLIPTDFWPAIENPYNGTLLFWTNINVLQLPSVGIRLLYLFQIGYYIVDFFYMILVDKPNDLLIMCFHHIASLSLLWMSYLPRNCWKIGCAILLIHEIGDVSLMFTKTLHYAQFTKISEILFLVHILVWIWSRLIWFPRFIVSVMDVSYHKIWQVIPCVILLSALLILHIFWTFLMVKVLYKAMAKGEQMADKRDRDVSQDTMKNENENENDEDAIGDMESKMQSIEMDRTNVTNNPSLKRRRSSLVESFIQTKESIIMPDNV